MFIKILLRNALACALVLTALNNCQAMEEEYSYNTTIDNSNSNKITNSNSLLSNERTADDYLQAARNNQKMLYNIVHEAILAETNENIAKYLISVDEVTRGFVKNTTMLSFKDYIEKGMSMWCFKYLHLALNNICSDQSDRDMFINQVNLINKIIQLCEKIQDNLINYRNNK